jgi:hypothetical protein
MTISLDGDFMDFAEVMSLTGPAPSLPEAEIPREASWWLDVDSAGVLHFPDHLVSAYSGTTWPSHKSEYLGSIRTATCPIRYLPGYRI